MSDCPPGSESDLRRRLGISEDAARAFVLAEGSHWQPNSLLTSDEYHRRRVRMAVDAAEAEVLTGKPAWRGNDTITRVYVPRDRCREPLAVPLPGRRIERAWSSDARERSLSPLPVEEGVARVPVQGRIPTVRLVMADAGPP
jgi:hypothetical protein